MNLNDGQLCQHSGWQPHLQALSSKETIVSIYVVVGGITLLLK